MTICRSFASNFDQNEPVFKDGLAINTCLDDTKCGLYIHDMLYFTVQYYNVQSTCIFLLQTISLML